VIGDLCLTKLARLVMLKLESVRKKTQKILKILS